MQIKEYTKLIGTRWGVMLGLRCDGYQAASLDVYGEWAGCELELMLQFVKRGDVVIDVGANIGSIAVPLAQRVGPTGGLIAFEPQRLPFYCLAANLAQNHVAEWAEARMEAVGEMPGLADVPEINPNQNTNTGGARLNDKRWAEICCGGNMVKVEQVQLDRIGVKRLDLIKIDAEGMESQVLRGAANTVDRHKPVIFCEALPFDAQNCEQLKEFFRDQQYRAWRFWSPLFNPNNAKAVQDNYWGGASDSNVMALPPGMQAPKWAESLEDFLTEDTAALAAKVSGADDA